ncbi:hypothetical protein DFA_01483 [Cavenderia fasciculata]|uniref:Pentatricopeptide repeat-containing protein n=1 Tax=Cavenderia fasciculata TaxID=261658 RepID=F4PT21_CACFS|nr:uncharacterized protein DFA_01483 [Cavenderia fasciculata]EGG21597.1 hypothetical protein DFA_01483 [Cavenderia fasciculata]|eukprot:XP_004359447.1 hypothetical protein DFA_01483 [Cavenderia fasciculata]
MMNIIGRRVLGGYSSSSSSLSSLFVSSLSIRSLSSTTSSAATTPAYNNNTIVNKNTTTTTTTTTHRDFKKNWKPTTYTKPTTTTSDTTNNSVAGQQQQQSSDTTKPLSSKEKHNARHHQRIKLKRTAAAERKPLQTPANNPYEWDDVRHTNHRHDDTGSVFASLTFRWKDEIEPNEHYVDYNPIIAQLNKESLFKYLAFRFINSNGFNVKSIQEDLFKKKQFQNPYVMYRVAQWLGHVKFNYIAVYTKILKYLQRCGNSNLFKGTLEIIRKQFQFNYSIDTHNTILAFYNEQGENNTARRATRKMRRTGINCNIETMTEMVRTYSNDIIKIASILSECREKKMRYSYQFNAALLRAWLTHHNRLIRTDTPESRASAEKHQLVKRAMDHFEELKGKGTAANSPLIYDSLLQCLFLIGKSDPKSGAKEHFEAVMETMRERNVEMSGPTARFLIMRQPLAQVSQFYESLIKEQPMLQDDAHVVGALIQAFTLPHIHSDYKDIEKLIMAIDQRGKLSLEICQNVIGASMVRRSNIRQCLAFIRPYLSKYITKEYLRNNDGTLLHLILQAACSTKDPAFVKLWITRCTDEFDFTLNETSYSILLRFNLIHGKTEEFEALVDEMKTKHARLTYTVLSNLVVFYHINNQTAEYNKYLKKMLNLENLSKDLFVSSVEQIIKLYLLREDPVSARYWFDSYVKGKKASKELIFYFIAYYKAKALKTLEQEWIDKLEEIYKEKFSELVRLPVYSKIINLITYENSGIIEYQSNAIKQYRRAKKEQELQLLELADLANEIDFKSNEEDKDEDEDENEDEDEDEQEYENEMEENEIKDLDILNVNQDNTNTINNNIQQHQ